MKKTGIIKILKLMFLFGQFILISFRSPVLASESFCPDGSDPNPNIIWCDDFENPQPLSEKYFEYNDDEGDFARVIRKGVNSSYAMQVKWQPGEVSAGNIKRTFGRNPVNSQSHSDTDFKEIYWRQYLKMQEGWIGNPYKLSRATILAGSNWSQAMIAHIWGVDSTADTMAMDPASGIDSNGNLVTTTYNDFTNLKWLGIQRGAAPIFSSQASGQWYCIEAHVKLNTPGLSDGIFEYWINGNLEASKVNLDWINIWQGYGINAVFFENHWNGGAPGERIRYFDNIVISTQPIGCMENIAPKPPTNLRISE